MNTHQPTWLRDAVFYEIYPQSFKDTNADGIGDFQGIIDKLDYVLDLGCNALWLNPCFESPFGDAGYDVADYYKAAPRYGTNADLRRLFDEVHKRGMHILLDLVPGHTSVTHPWFIESMKAEKNPYTDRYVWTDNVWNIPDGFSCIRGISERDGCAIVNFFSNQPALNYGFFKPDPEQPWQQPMDAPGPMATRQELQNIMRFWLSMGCDGFRVDMAGSLIKGDENCQGIIQLWQEVLEFLKQEYPEAAMISEWNEPDHSLMAGFHMDFLLHFGTSHYNDLFRCDAPYFSGHPQGDASRFVSRYMENYRITNGRGLMCVPSGNHDMYRLARSIHGDRLKLVFAFLMALPGAPFIYYGDEIGMRYLENIPSVEGGYHRTGARSPMQWDHSVNAGFSEAAPSELYIPVDPSPDRPTVEDAQKDPQSLYHEIRKILRIRKACPVLQSYAAIEFVYAEPNSYPLAFLRKAKDMTVLVVINPSDKVCSFPFGSPVGKAVYSFGGEAKYNGSEITVEPCSAGYYPVI